MQNEMSTTVTEEPPKRDEAADLAKIESFGISLSARRQKAIDARESAGIDRRWFDDIEAYEGRDAVTRAYAGLRSQVQGYINSAEPDSQQRARSTLVVNVTRRKVDTASARRADIALPTDDRNWDIRPSTVPELVEQMSQKNLGLTRNGAPIMVDDNGQQRHATMADMANRTMEQAKKAATAMRDEIDDQLDMSDAGCGFEGVIRAIIDDTCLLGVGIIKGPTITSRTKKVWIPTTAGDKTVHSLSRIKDLKPVSMRVDPWDFYPHQDCGENVKKGAGTWERSRITSSDIRHMADIPGYILPQLKKVLIEGPRKAGEKPADKPGMQTVVDTDTIFEQWEYHGEIDREMLSAAGCECGEEDIFKSYSGVVIMINDTVVKADIEILDTEELPYDIYVVNKCSGSWVGYSEAFLSRSAQKAITAGWRAMMDNAGQIVGGQIVMNRQKVEPADGKWELSGMKAWFTKGDAAVNEVFAVHEIPAHQAEYANIIKMGMEFLDQETAIPSLAEGNQGQATDVMGGMNLLLNASNVVQRRALKALDDQVTIPHIGRYVDWNMQYNPKPEIKGDFEVQARASGALMEQEIQNRGAMQLLSLIANPSVGYGMKKWDGVRRIVKSLRFDHKDFVKTDDEIAEIEKKMGETPQKAPAVEVAQIRADANAKIEAARQQFETQQNDLDRQNKVAVEMINQKMATMELTSVERQVLERMKVELATVSAKLNTQKELSQLAVTQANDHALAQHKVDIYKHNNPVITPPTEPVGRAKPGWAFQA